MYQRTAATSTTTRFGRGESDRAPSATHLRTARWGRDARDDGCPPCRRHKRPDDPVCGEIMPNLRMLPVREPRPGSRGRPRGRCQRVEPKYANSGPHHQGRTAPPRRATNHPPIGDRTHVAARTAHKTLASTSPPVQLQGEVVNIFR